MSKTAKTVNDVKIYVSDGNGGFILEHPSTGDVVKLKSPVDSPKMTIEAFQVKSQLGGEDEEFVQCVWFDKDDELHRDKFYGNMLVKV